jgi:hypothetical protein
MTSNITVLVVHADIDEDADDNKYDDRNHFQRGEPKFCVTNASGCMRVLY